MNADRPEVTASVLRTAHAAPAPWRVARSEIRTLTLKSVSDDLGVDFRVRVVTRRQCHDEWPFWAKRTRLPSTDRAEPGCRSTSGASSELMRLTFEGSIADSGPCCSLDQLKEPRRLGVGAVLARPGPWPGLAVGVRRAQAFRATAGPAHGSGSADYPQLAQLPSRSTTGPAVRARVDDRTARVARCSIAAAGSGVIVSTWRRRPVAVDGAARMNRRPYSATRPTPDHADRSASPRT